MSKNKGSLGERSLVFVNLSPFKSSCKKVTKCIQVYYFSSVLNIPHEYNIFQVLGNFKLILKNVECVTGLVCASETVELCVMTAEVLTC